MGPKLSPKLIASRKSPTMNRINNTFVLQQTDPQEMAKLLEELKDKRIIGPHGISNEKLKWCSPVIESFKASAFNQCVLERTYPANSKVAKDILLHKKGDKSNPENYRPISLLNSLGKVFGKSLQRRMINFCVKNKLLSFAQYDLRPIISCIDANNHVTDYMRAKSDLKWFGRASFVGLKKAVVTLDHEFFKTKMDFYDFSWPNSELLANYLNDRRQYINWNETNFSTKQNGTLSIGSNIRHMSNWFNNNYLTVNKQKFQAMSFESKQPHGVYLMDNPLTCQKSSKYFGIYLHSGLRFRDHIEFVVKNLNKLFGLMYRVRKLYPRKCLLNFYNFFARYVICYGVNGIAAKTTFKKIETSHRRISGRVFFGRSWIRWPTI